MATQTETVTDIDHEIRRMGRVFNQEVMSTTLALFSPQQILDGLGITICCCSVQG